MSLELIIFNNGRYLNNLSNSRNYNLNDSRFKPYFMSAAISPDGKRAIVEATPNEIYTKEHEDQLNKLPYPAQDTVKENIYIMQEFVQTYNKLKDSVEGRELANFYRKYGNRRAKNFRLDKIRVDNVGEGIVAFTHPDDPETNITINADYIKKYRNQISSVTDLSDYDIDTAIIGHEMGHQLIQTQYDRKKPESEVEFHNDLVHLRFYMYMANKYSDEKDRWTKKAALFSLRYQGKERAIMDRYITKTYPKTKKSVSDNSGLETSIDSYRKAA